MRYVSDQNEVPNSSFCLVLTICSRYPASEMHLAHFDLTWNLGRGTPKRKTVRFSVKWDDACPRIARFLTC